MAIKGHPRPVRTFYYATGAKGDQWGKRSTSTTPAAAAACAFRRIAHEGWSYAMIYDETDRLYATLRLSSACDKIVCTYNTRTRKVR